MPKDCDLEQFVPEEEPAVECQYEYNKANEVLKSVLSTVKKLEPLNDMIGCVQKHMDTIEPSKEAICFYTGFRPHNHRTFAKLLQEINAEEISHGRDPYMVDPENPSKLIRTKDTYHLIDNIPPHLVEELKEKLETYSN